MTDERLCVFTRYPEPGTTKTRLIPALGADAAACLQHAMTTHVLTVAAAIAADRGSAVEVRFGGGNETRMREAFGRGFRYRAQGDGDLGNRMQNCFRDSFQSGARRVVIVGSDVPGIGADVLESAFEGLRTHDLVIGPANDGGYYLIGLRADVPEIFRNVPWGTQAVLRRTLEIAAGLGLSVRTLPTRADVDRPEDLQVLDKAWGQARLAEAVCRVSVIIPTLNESSRIDSALIGLRVDDPGVEIIAADGGSTDNTAEQANAHGVKVLMAEPGRAKQMNAGAAAATGGILVFLHADTRLPENFTTHVRSILRNPDVAAGAFAFRLDADGRAYRILERLVNWRSRALRMPYGDQALFMKARTFRVLGGFPDLPVMEDFEMVRRLKHHGRISIAPAPAVTSARRWREHGFLKTTIRHQWLIAGYCLGVPPQRLTKRRP